LAWAAELTVTATVAGAEAPAALVTVSEKESATAGCPAATAGAVKVGRTTDGLLRLAAGPETCVH
jgi:hypothetical protein